MTRTANSLPPLVSASRLDPNTVRLFDCRHDLSDPEHGSRAFAQSHILGAIHAHIDRDLSGIVTGRNGRHPLPHRAAFIHWLSSKGLQSSDRVVVYDESNGAFAARLWWMLRWVGHDAVSILNGGFRAWRAARRPVESVPIPRQASEYSGLETSAGLVVDATTVLRNIESGEFQLLDARAADRFAGLSETIDPVGGHIPGALNRPFTENVDESGFFRSPEALREAFATVMAGTPPERIVHQCGSGVTACHNIFAMELAGLTGSRLYPGSWSEWCVEPDRPMTCATD